MLLFKKKRYCGELFVDEVRPRIKYKRIGTILLIYREGFAMLKRMKCVLILATTLLSSTNWVNAQEIGFVEDFALAEDRAAAIETLIPGTVEYYYYQCLNFQNQGKYAQVDKIAGEWEKKHRMSQSLRIILNRQAVLKYQNEPAKSLAYLKKRLGVDFNHQREQLDKQSTLKTVLDQGLISRESYIDHFRRSSNRVNYVENSAFDWMIKHGVEHDKNWEDGRDVFSALDRRAFLTRLERPDYANFVEIVEMIAKDLDATVHREKSKGFGSLGIHHKLMLSQLEAILKIKPKLINEQAFVEIYLKRLVPTDGLGSSAWRDNPKVFRGYLTSLERFVNRLGVVHNSLKGHVLYHLLQLDRGEGIYSKQRFMQYIKLPRNQFYMNKSYNAMVVRESKGKAYQHTQQLDLNRNYNHVTGLSNISNDYHLIEFYLQHFFIKETDASVYTPYLENKFVNRQLAYAKILNQDPDAKRWYDLLTPSETKTLKNRVDIDFVAENQKYFDVDDDVEVKVAIKNVKDLIVNVYQINTINYYQKNLREIDTAINLDGLVANDQQVFRYADKPMARVVRAFKFGKIKGAGVYVIDFIGNGKSSRVVLRKGMLRYLTRPTASGTMVKVFDNQHKHLTEARVILGGKSYGADKGGGVMLPFSTQGVSPLILVDGDFSTLVRTRIYTESYSLNAGIYIDRESLIAHQKAKILIKPNLLLGNKNLSAGLLENKQLFITTTNIHGISTRQRVENIKWEAHQDLVHEFTVPKDLRTISVHFSAKIKSIVTGEMVSLNTAKSFSVNGIEKTDKIHGLYITQNGDDYEIHILDKTGVGIAHQAVYFYLKHRDFKNVKTVVLQSDDEGVIRLGKLHDIKYVRARHQSHKEYRWEMGSRHRYLASKSIHQMQGQVVRIPYTGEAKTAQRSEFSFVQARDVVGGVWPTINIQDRFNHLMIKDGFVQIGGLPDGQYALKDKLNGNIFAIRILKGKRDEDYVVASAGRLQVVNEHPLQIVSIAKNKDGVSVQLKNHDASTRVHFYLTRYQPEFDLYTQLIAGGVFQPGFSTVRDNQTFYMQGRKIGDELRYILDRRLSKQYVGNMLRRPGLILNPWSIADSDAKKDVAKKGQEQLSKSLAEKASDDARRLKAGSVGQDDDRLTLDYLARGAEVVLNIKPNKNGVIQIPEDYLKDHHLIRVLAVDDDNVVMRDHALKLRQGEFVDRRLANVLREDEHYMQEKEISVIQKGKLVVLENQGSSEIKLYDSLEKVFGLYATFDGKGSLDKFKFILDWEKLTPKQRLEKYSKYTSHELNYFLYKKDQMFFQKIIKPYLVNKMHKTFMDHYLLGDDLSSYEHGFAYQGLNLVEKILLAQVQADRKEAIARQIRELYELSPIDMRRQSWYFNTALKAGELRGTTVTRGTTGVSGVAGGDLLYDGDAKDEGYGIAPRAESALGIEERVTRDRLRIQSSNAPGRGGSVYRSNATATNGKLSFGSGAGGKRFGDIGLKNELKGFSNGSYLSTDNSLHFERQRLMRQQGLSTVNAFYRRLEKTKQWIESNYYHLNINQSHAGLISNNEFWVAYASHDMGEPFVSKHFTQCTNNFTQMMFALSVLDLPAASPKHTTSYKEGALNFTASDNAIILHKRLRSVPISKSKVPILVSQNVYMLNDRYIHKDGQRLDKFVTDEFLPQKVYGCQVVVTNPTSTPHEIDLLMQIPGGAIPVSTGKEVKSLHMRLEPYKTTSLEYYFYFPAIGQFPMYGIQVARKKEIIAFEKSSTFNVVAKLSKTDTQSWEFISQHGTEDQVVEYVKNNNLYRFDVSKIAFRLNSKTFFNRLVKLLDDRQHFNSTVWSYSIKHNQPMQIKRFLESRNDFVNQCGMTIDTALLRINPVERKTYQHIDFYPLINVRVHRLGKRRKIVNGTFLRQYESLMSILSHKQTLNDEDRLAVVYYLLLQDRVEEAMKQFKNVTRKNIPMKLQYDYCQAYLSFFTGNLAQASRLVAKYKDFPVERWDKLFSAMAEQMKEIRGGKAAVIDKTNRSETQSQLAKQSQSIDMSIQADKILVSYRNAKSIKINYYLMDIELLFSKNPFVREFSSEFAMIKPNQTDNHQLGKSTGSSTDKSAGSVTIGIPKAFRDKNVLVEIELDGKRYAKPYFANQMTVHVLQNFGQVQVTEKGSGKGLAKAYIKVYAKDQSGRTFFYKDGYTDLRGRFDYVSLNTADVLNAHKYSILVLSDKFGAVVKEASPPQR